MFKILRYFRTIRFFDIVKWFNSEEYLARAPLSMKEISDKIARRKMKYFGYDFLYEKNNWLVFRCSINVGENEWKYTKIYFSSFSAKSISISQYILDLANLSLLDSKRVCIIQTDNKNFAYKFISSIGALNSIYSIHKTNTDKEIDSLHYFYCKFSGWIGGEFLVEVRTDYTSKIEGSGDTIFTITIISCSKNSSKDERIILNKEKIVIDDGKFVTERSFWRFPETPEFMDT